MPQQTKSPPTPQEVEGKAYLIGLCAAAASGSLMTLLAVGIVAWIW